MLKFAVTGAWDCLPEALRLYGEALAGAPWDSALLANRSAAAVAAGDRDLALADARAAASFRPDWAKAHYRCCTTLFLLCWPYCSAA